MTEAPPFAGHLLLALSATVSLLLSETGRTDGRGPVAARRPRVDTAASRLHQLLRRHYPDEAAKKRAHLLVEQLDSPIYHVREAAMKALIDLPVLPREILERTAKGPLPEAAWRSRIVLARAKPRDLSPLYNALQRTAREKPSSVVPVLLEAIAVCDEPFLKRAAGDALLAVVKAADAPRLRQELTSANVPVRAAAARAFGKAIGQRAGGELNRLASEPRQPEPVHLAAATALADLGDRRCFGVLLKLLSSHNPATRESASGVLSDLTAKHYGYLAHATPAERKKAIARWAAWITAEGKTARLHAPLKRRRGVGKLNGNTLLAFGKKQLVVEYDPAGKEIWRYSAWYARSAEKLANGNVLVNDYGRKRVVEVDRAGKVVWEIPAHGCENARPLANGNILIALHQRHLAMEVTRDNKIVWQYRTSGNCLDAHRLPNGNTLLVDTPGIKEVTPAGRVVWKHTCGSLYGIQPLPNGNVLIAGFRSDRVYEINRAGKTVWTIRANAPSDAIRLPNGNTLITERDGFREVTPAKKTVWKHSEGQWGTARR